MSAQNPLAGNFSSTCLFGVTAGFLTFTVPATVTSYQLVWPSAQASGVKQLQNDGSGNLSWVDPAGGAVTTMAAVGSAPNANGALISSNTLTLEPANGSFPGVLTAIAQTIGGIKTFSAVILGAAGAVAGPSFSFSADSDTGIYSAAANNIGFVTAGAEVARVGSGGQLGLGVTSFGTSTRYVDFLAGTAGVPSGLGHFLLSDISTDAVAKQAAIALRNKTNANGAHCMLYGTDAALNIGGGVSSLTAFTSVNIYTAADDNTTTGTLRLSISSAGVVTASAQVRAASLGVGNSASATTPGTVVKKIQIFDASGSSLGYIAVYDAIS